MTTPLPEEFRGRPDTYEGIIPMFVDAEYYKDGQLVHSTLRQQEEPPAEMTPGWTVQGGRHAPEAP